MLRERLRGCCARGRGHGAAEAQGTNDHCTTRDKGQADHQGFIHGICIMTFFRGCASGSARRVFGTRVAEREELKDMRSPRADETCSAPKHCTPEDNLRGAVNAY